MKKSVRVSIVIPVYNEEGHLPACLDAISRQTAKPYEVIVVDNNSTDGTADVARTYSFVRVVSETRQGVIHARSRGFNAARGDIIGRIDADTVMDNDWVAEVVRTFEKNDLDLITGSASYHDIALSRVLTRIDSAIRGYLAWILGKDVAMQGANMALKKSVWIKIRKDLCRTEGMHEDFDIGIHAQRHGYSAAYIKSMHASLSPRQLGSTLRQYSEYIMASPLTYARHGVVSGRHMYPVIFLAFAAYVPLKLLYNGYKSPDSKFSFAMLLTGSGTGRVNPATFVDE